MIASPALKAQVYRRAALLCGTTLLLAVAASASPATASGRTFYINFSAGSDAADGLSPATAWKRSPGDAKAAGKAAAMRLLPGDTVRFAGGVRYRGSIFMKASGTRDAPITFDGSGWGDRRAIFDGSDPLPAPTRCRSAADCLGSPHWQKLMRTTVPAGTIWSDWLFDRDRAMQISQWPSVKSYWEYDDATQLATIPRARLAQLQAGVIAVPGVPAALMTGSPALGLWTSTNELFFSTNFQIGATGIRYVQSKFRPYLDRDNKFTIMNAAMQVDGPGKFAMSGKDGVAIVWPGNGLPSLSVGSKRYGILLANVSHVKIRGFSFTNFVGDTPEFSPDWQAGGPVNSTSGSEGLQVTDNAFRSIVNMNKVAAVNLSRAGSTEIARNSFGWMPFGTAVTVSQSMGPVVAACNAISDIGRNGIRYLSVFRGEIVGNRMERLYGIHGAGINLYLDNRLISVRHNVILDANFPMTMHGENGTPFFTADATPPQIRISGNTMTSANPGAGAISSWGRNLRNVAITGNTLVNPLYSIRFYGNEKGMTVANNTLVGDILVPKTTQLASTGNQVHEPAGNGSLIAQQAKTATVAAGVCS